MRPLSLKLTNFMNHRNGEIFLENIKSALVVGRTKDNPAISNGVGKSSVFSAVEWVLFNKVHKTTLDKVVRDGAKKCVVEFCFENQGSKFKVHRSLSAKGTKNIYLYEWIDDDWVSITQRTPTETEEKLQKIVKITYKAFQHAVLFRQADLSGLVQGNDGSETSTKNRADILKEPMNLMRYSKKEELTQKRAKPIRKDIAAKESTIEMLGNPSADIVSSEQELEKCLAQVEEKEGLIKNDLQISLDEKKKNLDALKASLSSSDANVHQKVEDQHIKVKKLNYSIKELGESQTKTISNIEVQTESLSKKKKSLLEVNNSLSEKQAEQHRDITKISSEHKKVCDDEVKGNRLLARAEVELDHAKQSIPNTDQCPACQQSITKEYRENFEKEIQKVLDSKQKDIDFYKKQLSKCKKVKERLASELEAAKQHASDLENLKQQVKALKESIVVYEENIDNAKSEAKKIEDKLDSQSTELQEAIKHYDNLKEVAEKSDMTELNSKIFSVAREIKVYEQSIDSMRTEIQNLKTREGTLRERIKSRMEDKQKLDATTEDLKKLRHDLSIHQHVINSFSHKGIPTFIINTCLNELQFETNKTLQELRPDLEVEFDADLNFTYRRNGVEKDYQQLSYGQRVYVALSFKRGLAQVIARMSNCPLRFLEFDEVDSALDNAGLEAFTNAIKKWQDDFLILVITHRDSLKDKFSHAILVEEGDDGAETKLVTTW